jgi:peroxiredoxin Q/BCP
VAYFAASTDPVETNRRFAESLGLDYPILSDPSRKVARAYGVVGLLQPWASRWTFYIGLDGRLLAVDRKVSPRTAGRDVAERLAALGVARRSE